MFEQESGLVISKPSVPVQCASNLRSVVAVNMSPGSNRTRSEVPVPCSPSDEVVDVAAATADGERANREDDEDIASRLDQQASLQSLTGSQTLPARLHYQSDTHNQHSHRRTPIRNVFSCDTGSYIIIIITTVK